MNFFEALTIFGTMAILLLAASWLVPLARDRPGARIGLLALIAMIAQLIASMPPAYDLPFSFLFSAAIVAAPLLAFNWLFARAILEDDFRIAAHTWAIAGALVLLKSVWLCDYVGLPIPGRDFWYIATYVGGIAVFAHIGWLAISGFRDDLVVSRRGLRVGLVLVFGLSGIATLALETIGLAAATENLIRNSLTFAIAFAAMHVFASLKADRLFGSRAAASNGARRPDNAASQAIENLRAAMEDDQLFSRHGLSIARLGEHLGIAEHKLRALINRELGFRNFSAFLNHYRIAYAKKALTDPASDALPILTIAIDAGYTTLTTFNRAFKTETGMTPSQFRQQQKTKREPAG